MLIFIYRHVDYIKPVQALRNLGYRIKASKIQKLPFPTFEDRWDDNFSCYYENVRKCILRDTYYHNFFDNSVFLLSIYKDIEECIKKCKIFSDKRTNKRNLKKRNWLNKIKQNKIKKKMKIQENQENFNLQNTKRAFQNNDYLPVIKDNNCLNNKKKINNKQCAKLRTNCNKDIINNNYALQFNCNKYKQSKEYLINTYDDMKKCKYINLELDLNINNVTVDINDTFYNSKMKHRNIYNNDYFNNVCNYSYRNPCNTKYKCYNNIKSIFIKNLLNQNLLTDILCDINKFKMNNKEFNYKIQILQYIKKIMCKFTKNCNYFDKNITKEQCSKYIHVYGSYATGIYIPQSDFNIAIQKCNTNISDILFLQTFKKYLSDFDATNYCRFEVISLFYNEVPVLHIKDIQSNIIINISIYKYYDKCVKYINTLLNYNNDIRISQLITIVKYWSKIRNINNQMSFKINSFSFMLLCLKYLQTLYNPIICLFDCKQNQKTSQIDKFNDISYNHYSFKEYFSVSEDYKSLNIFKNNKLNNCINDMNLAELLFGFFEFYSNYEYDKFKILLNSYSSIYKNINDENILNIIINNITDCTLNFTNYINEEVCKLIFTEIKRACLILLHKGCWKLVCSSTTSYAPCINDNILENQIQCMLDCNILKKSILIFNNSYKDYIEIDENNEENNNKYNDVEEININDNDNINTFNNNQIKIVKNLNNNICTNNNLYNLSKCISIKSYSLSIINSDFILESICNFCIKIQFNNKNTYKLEIVIDRIANKLRLGNNWITNFSNDCKNNIFKYQYINDLFDNISVKSQFYILIGITNTVIVYNMYRIVNGHFNKQFITSVCQLLGNKGTNSAIVTMINSKSTEYSLCECNINYNFVDEFYKDCELLWNQNSEFMITAHNKNSKKRKLNCKIINDDGEISMNRKTKKRKVNKYNLNIPKNGSKYIVNKEQSITITNNNNVKKRKLDTLINNSNKELESDTNFHLNDGFSNYHKLHHQLLYFPKKKKQKNIHFSCNDATFHNENNSESTIIIDNILIHFNGFLIDKNINTFKQLHLHKLLLYNIELHKFPLYQIHNFIIQCMQNYCNKFICTQIGSGKMFSMLVVIINSLLDCISLTNIDCHNLKIEANCNKIYPRIIIIASTPRSAMQIYDTGIKLLNNTKLNMGLIYGDIDVENKIKHLNIDLHILIITPKIIKNIINNSLIGYNKIQNIILYELDCIFFLNFEDIIKTYILKLLKIKKKKNLNFFIIIFSSIYSDQIKFFINLFLSKYIFLSIGYINSDFIKQNINDFNNDFITLNGDTNCNKNVHSSDEIKKIIMKNMYHLYLNDDKSNSFIIYSSENCDNNLNINVIEKEINNKINESGLNIINFNLINNLNIFKNIETINIDDFLSVSFKFVFIPELNFANSILPMVIGDGNKIMNCVMFPTNLEKLINVIPKNWQEIVLFILETNPIFSNDFQQWPKYYYSIQTNIQFACIWFYNIIHSNKFKKCNNNYFNIISYILYYKNINNKSLSIIKLTNKHDVINKNVINLCNTENNDTSDISCNKYNLISNDDIKCLQSNNYLNDNIIHYYLKYIFNKLLLIKFKKKVFIFSTYLYTMLYDYIISNNVYARLKLIRHVKKINLFEQKVVIFPINFNNHWSVVILLKINTNYKFLHYDSYKGIHDTQLICSHLKIFLQDVYMNKLMHKHNLNCDISNINIVILNLIQQNNSFDCGVYLLCYIEILFNHINKNDCDFNNIKTIINLYVDKQFYNKRIKLYTLFKNFKQLNIKNIDKSKNIGFIMYNNYDNNVDNNNNVRNINVLNIDNDDINNEEIFNNTNNKNLQIIINKKNHNFYHKLLMFQQVSTNAKFCVAYFKFKHYDWNRYFNYFNIIIQIHFNYPYGYWFNSYNCVLCKRCYSYNIYSKNIRSCKCKEINNIYNNMFINITNNYCHNQIYDFYNYNDLGKLGYYGMEPVELFYNMYKSLTNEQTKKEVRESGILIGKKVLNNPLFLDNLLKKQRIDDIKCIYGYDNDKKYFKIKFFKKKWLNLILNGDKTWILASNKCIVCHKKWMGISVKDGELLGIVYMVNGYLKMSRATLKNSCGKHRIIDDNEFDKRVNGQGSNVWIINNVIKFCKPIYFPIKKGRENWANVLITDLSFSYQSCLYTPVNKVYNNEIILGRFVEFDECCDYNKKKFVIKNKKYIKDFKFVNNIKHSNNKKNNVIHSVTNYVNKYWNKFREYLLNENRNVKLCTIDKLCKNPIVELGGNLISFINLLKPLKFDYNLSTSAIELRQANKGDRFNAGIDLIYGKKINQNLKSKKVSINCYYHSLIKWIKYKNIYCNKLFILQIYYYLDVSSGKILQTINPWDANIVIQLSMKDNTDTNDKPKNENGKNIIDPDFEKLHYWEIKVLVDNEKYHKLTNQCKLYCHLFCFQIHDIFENNSIHSVRPFTWCFYYNVFSKYYKRKTKFKFFYLNHDGILKFLSNCILIISILYIEVDRNQIVKKLKEYLNKIKFDFDKCNTVKGKEGFYCVPIDVFLYQIDFCDNEINWQSKVNLPMKFYNKYSSLKQYLIDCKKKSRIKFMKEKNGGIFETSKNRNKSWAGRGGYKYAKNNNIKDGAANIRPINIKLYKRSIYHETELKNLEQITNTEYVNKIRKYGMECSNIYYGEGCTQLNEHTEYCKFENYINAYHVGEDGYLTISPHNRGYCNALMAIYTPCFSWIRYDLDGLSQRIGTHCIKPWHIEWKNQLCRIVDLYRIIRKKNIQWIEKHQCISNSVNKLVCKCISCDNDETLQQLCKLLTNRIIDYT